MSKLQIIVDRDLCIGAASCVGVAPEVFELDADDTSVVINPEGADDETIVQAAQACPQDAISLKDKETGQQIYPE